MQRSRRLASIAMFFPMVGDAWTPPNEVIAVVESEWGE